MSPYIDPKRRRDLYQGSPAAGSSGELNYQICRLTHRYLAAHGLSYRVLNDVVGALEGAKAEFQRRVVAPYEDRKCLLNGDVWTGSETNGGD